MADPEKVADALRAAKMYYYQNLTTEAIARELSVSRSTISRLLSFARKEGLVEVRIIDPQDHPQKLEEHIQRAYGLQRIHVVPMGERTTEAERLERVAQYTANYLSTIFSSNMILGIAWGTTTSAISRHLVPKTTHHSQIVQLNGAGNTENLGIEYASEILMRFAQNFRAAYHLFPVPAFFDRVETKNSLWEETSIQRILDLQARANLLLYSIGSVNAGIPSHVHTDGYLKNTDNAELKKAAVVGDIATIFFREDGSYKNISINQRSSGPPLELFKTKRGICVISGQAKLKGLHAAIRGKLMSELILDEPTARVFVEEYIGALEK
jgi:deoxyribonucleoside regulator